MSRLKGVLYTFLLSSWFHICRKWGRGRAVSCVSHTSVISHRRTSEHWINFQENVIKNITYIHVDGYCMLIFFSQTETAKHLTTSVITTVCQTLLWVDVWFGLRIIRLSTYCSIVLRLGMVFVLLTVWGHKTSLVATVLFRWEGESVKNFPSWQSSRHTQEYRILFQKTYPRR